MQQLHILNQKKQSIQDKMQALWDVKDKENKDMVAVNKKKRMISLR